MTIAPPVPKPARRRRRRYAAVLAAVLVAAAGALVYAWHRSTDTISYVQAEDTTLEALGKVTYAAISAYPDPAVTSQNLNPCGSGGHGDSMTTTTTVSGITADKAAGVAGKVVNYLHSNGYSDVSQDQKSDVHGVKDGVTVTVRYDGRQSLSFSAATGCNVKSQ